MTLEPNPILAAGRHRDLIITYDAVLTAFVKVQTHVRNEEQLGALRDAMRQAGCEPHEFEAIDAFIVSAYHAGQEG